MKVILGYQGVMPQREVEAARKELKGEAILRLIEGDDEGAAWKNERVGAVRSAALFGTWMLMVWWGCGLEGWFRGWL